MTDNATPISRFPVPEPETLIGVALSVMTAVSLKADGETPVDVFFGRGLTIATVGARQACWMALSLQALGPTGRTKVQNSSNFTGSVRLPSTTCPERSSTV